MANGIYTRVCYRNGIVKDENKVYETHAICECEGCFSLFYPRKTRNCVTAYTDDETKVKAVESMLKNWTCKNGNQDLPVEYIDDVEELL